MKTLSHYIEKRHVRYMPPEVQAQLVARTPLCAGDAAERMFWLLNNITDYPTCKACSTKLSSFHWEPYLKPELRSNPTEKQGYRPYCGRECSYKHGTKQESYKKTCIERYGVPHPMQTEEVIAKLKATNIDKHGEANPMRWTGKKFLDTITQKHGTDIVPYIPGVNEKIAKTKQEQTQKLLPKKILEIEKLFDVTCISDISELKLTVVNVLDIELEWKHTCGRTWQSAISFRGIRRCPSCSSGTSRGEQEVTDFVKSLGASVETRTKSIIGPRELDIWLPEHKIAIEFDGTYWHSAKFENRKNCMLKLEKCEALGSQLITLQEHLWVNKKDAVKNRLSSILGTTQRIGARKTVCSYITPVEAKRFLETNHLQGSAGSSIQIGLRHNDVLVCVATFGKPRWAHGCSWELIRMASLPGMTVQGGASKLIKFFRASHEGSLLSYADRCWSQGNVYKQLGFQFSHNTPPSYWWIHHSLGTYARYQTQKAKLSKLLGSLNREFCPELSEEDNMRRAGFLPLYDRGNSVWVLA